jgi:periplasmic protein CpxP/Spy
MVQTTQGKTAMADAGQRPGAWGGRGAVAVGLLALAATAWQVAQAQPDGGPGHPREHAGLGMHGGGPGGPGGMDGRGLARWLDDVQASAEQRSRIQDILKAARQDIRRQREAGAGQRDRAMQIFTQATLDPAAAEALRQQMLAEHDRSSQRMMQALLDAAAVLTPEQRSQLGQRLQQRRELMQRHRAEREALKGNPR